MNIKKRQLPRLRTATKAPILLDGTILLFVKIGELRVRVWFGIVKNLAVDILLGTSFIDRYIQGIFLSERKILPWHSQPVPILSRNNNTAVRLHLYEQHRTEMPVTAIRVAQQTMVPPRSKICIPANSSVTGMFQLEPRSLAPSSPMLHVAPGIVKPTETKVFLIFICNFSNTSHRFSKHMTLATGVAPSPFIVSVHDVKNKPVTPSRGAYSTVAAVH